MVPVADLDDDFASRQHCHGIWQQLGEDLAEVAIGDIAAGEPKDAWWRTEAQGELDEVTVLAHDDDIVLIASRLENGSIISVPQSQIADSRATDFKRGCNPGG